METSHVIKCCRSIAGCVEQLGLRRPGQRSDKDCEEDELSALLAVYFTAVSDMPNMDEGLQNRIVLRAQELASRALKTQIELIGATVKRGGNADHVATLSGILPEGR
jgi:hypothetical protein